MRILMIVIAFCAAWAANADEFVSGTLIVEEAYAIETPRAAKAGAGYFTITNTGDAPDRLIAVEADFPMIMLHKSVETDGVARMEHQGDGIALPPGESVVLAPGGLHIMFMGLPAPFEVGDTFTATLLFDDAAPLQVTFEVDALADHLDKGDGS